jgi:hypothetical protein
MKLKLTPALVILGLFVFKVSIIDGVRNFGHHTNGSTRGPSSERSMPLAIR